MIDNESINLLESAISDCESEIKKHTSLTADAAARQAIIQKLETELSDLRANTNGLEQKARATRLTTTTAMISLERSDLTTLEGRIDVCANHIVQLERRAQGLLQQVWSEVRAVRKSAAERLLETHFDIRRVNAFAGQFPDVAYSVLELDELQDTLFHDRWLPAERDLVLHDARFIRSRSKALLAMAANELSAEFTLINIELMPIAKPKQAVVGNQLGTLAHAVAV
jgi:hypothetical protein